MSKLHKQSWRIALNLLRRDFYVIRKRLLDGIINNFIIISCLYAVVGIFGKSLGIMPERISMIFIGIIIGNIVYIGYTQAIKDVFDLDGDRLISYHLTLPLSFPWFIARLVGRYLIEISCTSFPSFILCKLLLGSSFVLTNIRWGWFLIIYLICMLFVAVLFLVISFASSASWFRFNIWQRILWPMQALGCTFYSWHKVTLFDRYAAYLLLINPQTYLNEGMRAALIPQSVISLPPLLCCGIISGCIIVGSFGMYRAIRQKLECVC